jgi:DNA-binding CsgD family transcriptional regulator
VPGRAGETARAAAALRTSGAVLLVGETGAGKTHLARALAGGEALWITGTRATATIPFGALALYLPRTPGGDLTAVLLKRLSDRMQRSSAVVVDDAHLLDPSSAAILADLAKVPGRALRFIVAIREDAAVPDGLARLGSGGRTPRVRLEPLDVDGIAEVAGSIVGGSLDASAAASLHRLTSGNALACAELVATAAADAHLAPGPDGRWRWQSAGHRGGVRQVLADRLAALTPPEREVLLLVALAEPADTDAIVALSATEVVESMCERRWLQATAAGDLLSLPHSLYGELLVERSTPVAVRRMRRRLADQLTGHRHLLRRVVLRLDAADQPAESDLLDAAAEALARRDGVLAERLAVAAPQSPRQAELTARALVAQQRFAEAEAALSEAAARYPDRLELIDARVSNLVRGLRRDDQAVAYLSGLGDLPQPAATVVRVQLATLRRRYADAVAACAHDPLLNAIEPAGPGGYAVYQLAGAYYQTGRVAESLALLLHHDREARPAEIRLALRFGRIGSLLAAGRPDEAAALAASLSEWGDQADWLLARVLGQAGLGGVLAYRGDYRRAAAMLAAIDTAPLQESNRHWLSCQLACAQAAEGRVDAAIATLRTAAAMRESGSMPYADWDERRARAFALACGGAAGEAADLLRHLYTDQLASGAYAPALDSAHTLARVHDAAGAQELCGELPELPGLHAVHAAFIHALADRTTVGLMEVSGRYEAIGAYGLAAEAADAAVRACAPSARRERSAAVWRRDSLQEGGRTAPLPWWSGSPSNRLSRREREIAQLAASGLSTPDIAARLVLSVRTVENHLQRVYGKLGVTGRAGLRSALARSA